MSSLRRTSLFPVHWVATAVLLSVMSADLVQLGMAQSTFNCSVVCFSDYYASLSRDCEIINYVLRCYNDHLSDCESLGTASLIQVQNEHETMRCPPWNTSTEAGATTEPATTSPPISCPATPSIGGPAPPTFPVADVLPVVTNPDCIEYDPQQLQHCSLFGYSTLRPFLNYRNGFEACHIPGSWFLLRHWTVSVEVEGIANGENGDHTKLSKVNVTFYRSGSCLGETKSYVATYNSSLPQTFSDLTLPSNCSANLQLQVNQEGTLATLMAPWINATVIIRRLPGSNVLAVILQVPGRLGFESDGLCTGCPAHSRLAIDEFTSGLGNTATCRPEVTNILFNCYTFAFLNYPEFYLVLNVSYPDMCYYSLWRHNSASNDFFGFLIAVANDSKLLQDYGNIPRRNFEIIAAENPTSSDSSCYPSSETNSSETTTEAVSTTDSIDTTDTTDSIDTTDTTDSVDTMDINNSTTTSVRTDAASTTVSQQTTTERAQTDLSTAEPTGDVQMISSSTGNHHRLSTMPNLFALSILSAFGVRLLLR